MIYKNEHDSKLIFKFLLLYKNYVLKEISSVMLLKFL